MASTWGNNFKISIFGESHGQGIGVVVDGLPPGIPLDMAKISSFMKRRAPGRGAHATPRKEGDVVEIQSGVYQNKTTGTPLCGLIKNTNTRSQDYEQMPLRPSHGDYTGAMRYATANDPRGGGHFSGRLTAPMVFAGGIAKEFLGTMNIQVGAHIASIGPIWDDEFSSMRIDPSIFTALAEKDFPVLNNAVGTAMLKYIEEARLQQDSVGGIVACAATGLPAGIGSPMFGGLENLISSIVFGIPAVRGIEFGTGFAAASLYGSQHNDPFVMKDNVIETSTNHHGGIIGGISSGMPILVQVAFKPTPSISQKQHTLDLATGAERTLEIHGRHDPCIVPRAVPVVEAAIAIALADALLEGGNPVAVRTISNRD